MKNMLIAGFLLALSVVAFNACKNDSKGNASPVQTAEANATYACPMHPDVTGKAGDKCSKCGMNLEPVKTDANATYACPMHPEITGKKGDKCSKCGMELTEVQGMTKPVSTNSAATNQTGGTASVKAIVDGYLALKNALISDKTQDAAAAGKALEGTFKGFDKSALTTEQKKTYEEIEDDAREHTEHIGSNGGKIEHQREHFALLSKDVYDLVKAFGSAEQPLYQDFCPMYDKGKGAIWLSETKDIKNPYYGKKMLTCGKVKEEIK